MIKMKTYKLIIILSIFLLLIIVSIQNALSDENTKIIYVDNNGTNIWYENTNRVGN